MLTNSLRAMLNTFVAGRAVALAVRMLAALCVLAATSVQAASLTLALARSPLALPVRLAADRGLFAAQGLQVNVVECPSGLRCLRLLTEGQADLATAADTAIMFTSFKTSDFVVLGTVGRTREDTKLLARRSAGIALPRDLAGKTVGVISNTSAHYFLDAYLLFHGVDPKDVKTVALQPEQCVAALSSHEVDAVALWEPLGHKATLALGDDAVVLRDEGGVYLETFNLLAHRRLAGTRDADLAAVLRAIAQAERLIRQDAPQAQALLRSWLGLDADFVKAIWPHLRFQLSLDQALLKTLESEARWAVREGHVKADGVPNLLPLLHSGPLRSVNADAVGIAR